MTWTSLYCVTKKKLDDVVDILEYIEMQTGMITDYEKTIVYHIGAMTKSNAKL